MIYSTEINKMIDLSDKILDKIVQLPEYTRFDDDQILYKNYHYQIFEDGDCILYDFKDNLFQLNYYPNVNIPLYHGIQLMNIIS
jgi:hypothetical protein